MIEQRLRELGLDLPPPSPPAATYDPYVKAGFLVFVSGQLPVWKGDLKYVGKVGLAFSIEDGQEAARLCALNILTQLKVACEGDLNRVMRCVRLGGFVNATDDFKDHSKVMNGASELMIALFGEKGRHARVAVGVNALPLGVAVEVDAIFEVDM
ncbi:MAG: RidA family protein [Proteobacteria bacterium]|nr:RidA family protein [Pseudomonadota bacterium]